MAKLQPHEVVLIQRIYDEVAQASWFNRNAVTERELLKLILENYAEYPVDETALLRACDEEARNRFSRIR